MTRCVADDWSRRRVDRIPRADMQLVYTSDVEGENVLRPEVILWARDLERRLTSLPGYAEDMCLQVPGNLGARWMQPD